MDETVPLGCRELLVAPGDLQRDPGGQRRQEQNGASWIASGVRLWIASVWISPWTRMSEYVPKPPTSMALTCWGDRVRPGERARRLIVL